MKQDLISKYGQPVPRYTSYPTAPHFHDGIDEHSYARWLAAVPGDQPISLYLHIPYCDTLCWFCGCHTKITARYEPVAAYLISLMREIDLVAEHLGEGRQPVAHIHMGGGSPTMLRPGDLRALMKHIRTRFDVLKDCEIAIEMDPRDERPGLYDALADIGINRLSVGVQDANPRIQKAINRIQSIEATQSCINAMRERGVQSINIDLIYGLPHQTVLDVHNTVKAVLDMNPDRIALFGYAHVPWMKSHQKMIREDDLPNSETRLESASKAAEILLQAGFQPIGIDHFARPDDPLTVAHREGSLHRNFQGYTTDDAEILIGLGASSVGRLSQGFIQNLAPMADYRRAVESGHLPVSKGIALLAEDKMRAAIIHGLMCDGVADLLQIPAAHGFDSQSFSAERRALAPMVQDGLATLSTNGELHVTEKGKPFVRTICAVFDTYLAQGKARHSTAI